AVYRDLASPATKEVGDLTARAVRLALAPLRSLLWSFERVEEWVSHAVSERLRGVPAERIQPPEPTIAVPALMSLTYTTNDCLRAMYAELLATSMDKTTATSAHPAYVEIIKQMTSDEARIIHHVATTKGKALIFYKPLEHKFPDRHEWG